jgi:hypothetical protein
MFNAPYPIEILPQILRNAIFDVGHATQAPIPLVAAGALTAMSLASQNLANVELPIGKVIPINLFLLTCAASGERKSTVDKLFMKPIYDAEKLSEALLDEEINKYESKNEVWTEQKKSLKRMLSGAVKDGDLKLAESAQAELDIHNQNKPIVPKSTQFILRDATPEAVSWHLFSKTPSAGLISDEGGLILNGRAMADLPMLNGYWDGTDVYVNRRDDSSFVSRDKRLTFSIAVQEKSLSKFVNDPDSIARDCGYLARCLFSHPVSTQGQRFLHTSAAPELANLELFQNRTAQILYSSDSILTDKQVLTFSHDAKNEWVRYANMVESFMSPGACYFDVRDVASKSAEQAARLAALFHIFENKTGAITFEIMFKATTLANWYLNEFSRCFSIPKVTQEMHDAMKIHEWLIARYCDRQEFLTKVNHIRKYGPNSTRNAMRLKKALATLMSVGGIQLLLDASTGTNLVQLNINALQYNPYISY